MGGTETTVLALDVHGGDHGLAVTVPAALAALAAEPDLRIILVGYQQEIEARLLGASASVRDRLDVQASSSVLPNDAKPAAVLRRGRDSSMWKAFELVAEGQAHACVSGGSTAAMMVLGVKLVDDSQEGIHFCLVKRFQFCRVFRIAREVLGWVSRYRIPVQQLIFDRLV